MRTSLIVIFLMCMTAFLTGCGAANEAADEGANALKSGMRSKERAKDYAGQKEAYDKQAEEF